MLADKSYTTREIVLQQLCIQFPQEKKKYLELSKDWIGNNDKSLRITWLGIALLTNDYYPEKQTNFYKELLEYASPYFEASVRKNALEMLLQINPKDEKVLTLLVNATTHHKWQFVAFAKNTIRSMLKKETFKMIFSAILPKLNEKEQNFLKGELK